MYTEAIGRDIIVGTDMPITTEGDSIRIIRASVVTDITGNRTYVYRDAT